MDISVIIPIFNVENFLRQCLESLRNQTFQGRVEFICINDGSTDDSLSILKEFEKIDPRFVVVNKENEGYGKSMNLGIEMAKGEYVAVLESDDWAEESMLEKLYTAAQKSDAEVVKANYNEIIGSELIPHELYSQNVCNRLMRAVDYPPFLFGPLAIWSGLYRRKFLLENNISFNETAGASYQDTSFAFLVWMYTEKLYLISDCLVNYRIQNADSSVNSAGKVFCICDEFERIEDRLDVEKASFYVRQIEAKMKFIKYRWNHRRLEGKSKDIFYHRMLKELFEADKRGCLDKSLYSDSDWKSIEAMLWSYAKREYDEVKTEERNQLVKLLPMAILAWYDFVEGSEALYIGRDSEPLVELLQKRNLRVTTISLEDAFNAETEENQYDYVIAIGCLDDAALTGDMVKNVVRMLKTSGILLLGTHNPLGIRYMCGDHKPKENLPDAHEIDVAINAAGFKKYKRYSVFPGLEEATQLFDESYMPAEDLANRIIPAYWHSDSVCEQESTLYDTLRNNGLFHQLANAYLYECSLMRNVSNTLQVTINIERGEQNAVATVLFDDEYVEKKALFQRGFERIDRMIDYQKDLEKHGIKVVPMTKTKSGNLSMKYIDKPIGSIVIQESLRNGDMERFLALLDRFRDMILASSRTIKKEGIGDVLECGYFDMIPLNSFFINGDFFLFDQEFCLKYYPAEVIISRMITSIYHGHPELQRVYPSEEVYKRYNILDKKERLRRIAARDLAIIRKDAELREHHKRTRASLTVISENKRRNLYGVAEYRRIFVDIFKDVLSKEVFIFGAGKYAKSFLQRYNHLMNVRSILDNDSKKWGESLEDHLIKSPESVLSDTNESVRVFICVKQFEDIMKQLYDLGVNDIVVYNPNRSYSLPQDLANRANSEHNKNPKYNIGYIAGVFDMFHMGHLNVIRRAKEQCKHLIVGICSDEWVRSTKKTEPIMPFDERIELVRSCRFVDEAVRIPPEAPTTWDAYKKYHFDVQFSGSDYENDPGWLSAKAFLEKNGSTIVFFPYTESTSSTKLKELINRKLL